MRKFIIIFVIGLVLALGLFICAKVTQAPDSEPVNNSPEGGSSAGRQTTVATTTTILATTTPEVNRNIARPWLEVLTGLVEQKTASGWTKISSGDELANMATIRSNASSTAIIHLPDHSLIRLNPSSEFILTEADYWPDTNSLKVRIKLTAGRIWSKIVELATPESYWEVETTNAVAAVRGTSFGMAYVNNETTVIGGEHTVDVSLVKGNIRWSSSSVKVATNKILFINDKIFSNTMYSSDSEFLAKEVKDLATVKIDTTWVQQALKADAIIKTRIDSLTTQGFTAPQIRQILVDDTTELHDQLILQRNAALISTTTVNIVSPATTTLKTATSTPVKTSSSTTTIKPLTNTITNSTIKPATSTTPLKTTNTLVKPPTTIIR